WSSSPRFWGRSVNRPGSAGIFAGASNKVCQLVPQIHSAFPVAPMHRKVLDCGSPLPLSNADWPPKAPEDWRSPKRGHAKRRFPGQLCLVWALLIFATTPAPAEPVLTETEERIIRYEATDELTDPVALFQKRLAAGTATLKYDSRRGYLPALL